MHEAEEDTGDDALDDADSVPQDGLLELLGGLGVRKGLKNLGLLNVLDEVE